MKKAIVVLLLVISTGLFAQKMRKMNYYLGLGSNMMFPYQRNIGLMNNLEGHPETSYRPDFGYFSELAVSYRLSDQWRMVTALNYSFSSMKITDRAGFQKSIGKITTSGLSLPVLAEWQIPASPVSLSFGPYLGYCLQAREKGSTTITPSNSPESYNPAFYYYEAAFNYDNNIRDNYTTFDFGFSIQLDYRVIDTENFMLKLYSRYSQEVIDVVTNRIETYSTAMEWNNFNWLVGIGFEVKHF